MTKDKANAAVRPAMKVLIADDHWVVRESLKQVTKQLSRNFEPLEASDFKEVMAILEQHAVGLMLIDLIMPGFNEFDGLRQLRAKYPGIPIVVISIHDNPEYVLEAIGHGVIGYIPKSAGAEEIIRSLTRVISGEVSFPRHLIERSGVGPQRSGGRRGQSNENPNLDVLTSRERGILALIGEGKAVSKIALKLAISPQTVRVHLGNAMRKLDLKNREEAIHFAINHARLLANEH